VLFDFPIPFTSKHVNKDLIMPTYRSITISFVSQYDILAIPEYPPPEPPPGSLCTQPTLINTELDLISVYIPTYPCSQFWISYSIAPPYPPKALFYFKLFLKGACIVSWGCGKEDDYRGKTMFGLFGSGTNWKGEPEFQKRVLCFGEGYRSSDDDLLEIKVYRCKGRKRCPPVLKRYGGVPVRDGNEIEKQTEGSIRSVM
jgi:hypothetical protein